MSVSSNGSTQFGTYQPPPKPELLLQSALDSLPSHVAVLDDLGDIIGVNAAWKRFGDHNEYRAVDHGIGQNYLNICEGAQGRDASEASIVANGIRDIMNERRRLFNIEYPCHSPSVKRWFKLQIARFEWEGRLRVITAHQNVTDLKKAQHAFAQSQKRLQTVVDTVVDGIFTTDERGVIESVNPAAAEIFGYQPDDLIGHSIDVLMTEPYKEQYTTYVQNHRQVHSRRYAEVGHEVTGIRRNGQRFPMYIAMSRAFVSNRWLFTGIVQDLTPRKQIETERLEKERLGVQLEKEREMRKLKNRFMSMISHELRTPLSVIMLSSDFLKRYGDKMPEEEKMECIASIQTQVRHLENMMDDVSALSRTENMQVNLRTEAVDFIDFVSDIVANARMVSENSHRLLYSRHGDTPGEVLIDTKLIRQAFSNLLSNAVKYSEPGSTVRFELVVKDNEAIIRVIDQGIGIPEADQKNLFEPFHRAGNVGSHNGTGLGLAVTKQAIELHDGSIEFESQEGVGTQFTVRMPLDYPVPDED